MKFRPCIDIHEGKVKQIVGATLRDGCGVRENYVSDLDSAWYAELFRRDGLRGGHVIALGPSEENRQAVLAALRAYPGGLQAGGGITDENARLYLDAGASHVIVTSFVFAGGAVRWDRLRALTAVCGRERLVLDLSCRKTPDGYQIATDRWQTLSEIAVEESLFAALAPFCDEFLVHAVSREGTMSGIDPALVALLSSCSRPVTYAGGIASNADIQAIDLYGRGRIDFTVGSALDLFGGPIAYAEMKKFL